MTPADAKINSTFLIRYFPSIDVAPNHDVLKTAKTLRDEIGNKPYARIANKAMCSDECGNIPFGIWGGQKVVFVPK